MNAIEVNSLVRPIPGTNSHAVLGARKRKVAVIMIEPSGDLCVAGEKFVLELFPVDEFELVK